MRASSRYILLHLICVSAGALGAGSGAFAQAVEYALTELPPLPGHIEPIVAGIDSSGMAVGFDSDGKQHSFPILWQGSRAEQLPGLGGIGAVASRINRSGQIAGYAIAKDGASHAVVWSSPANVTDLNTAKGESRALGINDNGQVVGFQSPTTDPDPNLSAIATLWNGKTAVALPIPPISQTPPASEAQGINASGVIVGTIFGGTLNGGNTGVGRADQQVANADDEYHDWREAGFVPIGAPIWYRNSSMKERYSERARSPTTTPAEGARPETDGPTGRPNISSTDQGSTALENK